MFWKKSPCAVLATLMVIHLLAQVDRNILLGFAPQITGELAINNAQYGFLVGAVWVLSYGVMAVVLGALADRHSRPRVIGAGMLIWSVCTIASGFVQNFEQMVAARFMVATGEAALVPAATALLMELFSQKRRGTAMGLFYLGIPLGIGCSFLLAGTLGATHGWRTTFYILGVAGIVIGLPLMLMGDRRSHNTVQERGAPLKAQLTAVLGELRSNRVVRYTVAGFVLAHLVYPGISFAQLWMTRERGMDPATIATTMGAMQIVFGSLGALAGGILSDRLAPRFKGGHASVLALLVLLFAPFMIAFRLVPTDSPLFYVGMAVGIFMVMSLYGSATTAIQGAVPARMRSTVMGFSMLLLNVFSVALGTLVVGWISDSLATAGVDSPLTPVLLVSDIVALVSGGIFFYLAARIKRESSHALPAMGIKV
ncbi:MFS transporter [Pseudomonas fluorescens]|uniref:Putative L-galactonate transporter n=1 Tax=Pseudomonas fluorescens TaxID=294 RepID=A0A5E7D936_PSEFL|nr:MFS transporter [Pseudomonas fluorescens]VVO12671.1 putative L-galactonate transporter [Pseudomonas fluorescens]